MNQTISFGNIYFHHLQDKDYVGPRLAREVGATFLQLDSSDVSLWHQIHRAPGSYDWSLLDRAYNLCSAEGIEAVPSFLHHFAPPLWIKNGPFNNDEIKTLEYERFGTRFTHLTVLEKSFADFITAFVERYGSRTQLYVLSHEWNLTQEMFKKPDQTQNNALIRNQLGCTMLAYKIIKERTPQAKFAYGLLNLYRKDVKSDERISRYTDMIEGWPFSPGYMIKQYVETGDEDFLNVLATMYIFHLGYSDSPEGFGTIYLDNSIGNALQELWDTEIKISGKVFRYRDYIKEIIVSPFAFSTCWVANPNRVYTESEQAALLKDSVLKILEVAKKGIPVSRIIVTLNDKNEDWTEFAPERWIYVPEGIYKICGFTEPLRRGPTDWTVTYEPKQAAKTFKQLAEANR